MHSRRGWLVALMLVGLCALGLSIAVDVRWGAIDTVDSSVARALNRLVNPHPGAVTFWKSVSLVGSPVVWDVLAAVAVGVLCLRGRFRTGAAIAVAVFGAAMLSTVLKVLVGRPRPTFVTPVAHASGMSYPSGHALTSFVAAWVFVALLIPVTKRAARAWAAACAALAVLAIGFSRLILGVHYLTDVLGAWLIGAVWLGIVVGVLRRSTDHVDATTSVRDRSAAASRAEDALLD